MTDYRMVVRRTGGPEVIEREPIGSLSPGAGEVVVRHGAIGLNFIDTYQRGGLYPTELPTGLGTEGAGVVEQVGEGVADWREGDRVAYAIGPLGAYASARTMPADVLVRLPASVTDQTAAAVMLKGLTVDMLVGPCAKVQPGQSVLVHAAAGGIGTLLVPWLKAIGATVIAHAGSRAKAEKARAAGADHALDCGFDVLAEQVRTVTDGGVDVVFDGVGKASWDASIGALKRRGLMVSFGNASGAVPPVEPLALSRAGSLYLTRPTLFAYLVTQDERETAAARLFAMLASGRIPVEIGQTFALADAADAHRALEARQTTGSTVLLP
jgi:NADPH:quinone reductase